MSNWTLKINNIGGFKDKREFLLKEGLNLVIGENATGKTTLVNALKLLNNLSLKEFARGQDNNSPSYQDFLNNKTKNGSVELINGNFKYFINLSSPVGRITSFLDGNQPLAKRELNLISKDIEIIKFTYLDKENRLMESIEYSGNIESILNEIVKISNIKNYELILNNVKKLNTEYLEKKEHNIKKLNDERKEISLKIKENLKNSENLEKELRDIQVDQESSEELIELKEKLENKNQEYNKIRLKELDKINRESNKLHANIDKSKKKLILFKNKKSELNDFIELENKILDNEKKITKYDEKLESLSKDKSELNYLKHNINHQIQLLQETLESTVESEVCQHCLNPISSKRINKKLGELEIIKKAQIKKYREIYSKIQNLSKDRTKLNDLITNQKNIPKDIAEISSKVKVLQKRLVVNEEKSQELEEKIKTRRIELSKIQDDIDEIQKKIIELSNQDEGLKEKHTEILTKLNMIKEENNKLTQRKGKLIQKILILPENYNILIKRTEILIEKLNEYIEEFYFEFIDFINSELEILLEKLDWRFQEVSIDDDLNLIIKNIDNRPQKFHSLSDFEKKSIAILIILIIKMKYYSDYPIFVIDEHLNSADSKRFMNFIPHLYEKVLKSKIKLFIITSLPNDFEVEFLDDFESIQHDQLKIFYRH